MNHYYPEQYWRDGKGNIVKRWCEAPILASGKISKKRHEYWRRFYTDSPNMGWVGCSWCQGVSDDDDALEIANTFFYRMTEEEAIAWYDGVKLKYLLVNGTQLEPPRYNESEED